MRVAAAILAGVALAVALGHAQSRPLVPPAAAAIYARLLPEIEQIRIFDHHAHPGWPDDPDIDPAPAVPGTLPLRLRPENLDWVAAARAMEGFPFADLNDAHRRWLAHAKAQRRRAQPGVAYFNAVLDRLGIEASAANRITMPDYLDPQRFRWVFYADAFMFPLDNSHLAARNPDEQAYMPEQTKLLRRYLQQAQATALPPTFDEYLALVSRILQQNRDRGAIAAKFEAAYFRSLRFGDPTHEQALGVYDRYRAGGTPSDQDYRRLQDYVFRHIVSECGRLHLAVHIHTSMGTGDYFSLTNANVLNLDPLVRDPRYGQTTFVLIHGGYPFDREAMQMAFAKNVFLDSSATGSFLLYPDAFEKVLRGWLETVPDKITYGSDAFPQDEAIGAEEMYWFGVHNARTALAAALAGMVAAREVSEATALQFAHGYLHDNAARLYSPR